MLKKLDHIGIAVADLEEAVRKFEQITGKAPGHKETVAAQKVATAFFPVGEVRLELLQGTAPDSPISKFIAKRGEGIHHLCFEVDDLAAAKSSLESAGLRFVEQVSEEGAGGSRVAFIHPKSAGGVLIELVEYPKPSTR
ncbi:MAG: methylmalonyl-CoA epimerase [Calditrichaeota bacterium]|nr:MAG: methylmalonyl-CoA epimerase [Calditrichota bacterium]